MLKLGEGALDELLPIKQTVLGLLYIFANTIFYFQKGHVTGYFYIIVPGYPELMTRVR